MRGKRTQIEMQAQILNSFSLTLSFAFGFALGLVTRVFPCICICVLYLHQMCEPFFPVHVLRRIRPNKCCKQTEKFWKVCLHHSNLSVSLENGIKKNLFHKYHRKVNWKPKTKFFQDLNWIPKQVESIALIPDPRAWSDWTAVSYIYISICESEAIAFSSQVYYQ